MGQYVEKEKFNEMDEDKYKESFEHFDDFYGGEKSKFKRIKETDFEKKLNEIKIIESIEPFVKDLVEAEKKEPILDEMKKVFQELKENFNLNHKNNDGEEKKSLLDNIDKNKENCINAIYISKNIIEDEDFKIHDYAEFLFNKEEVKDIEVGNNNKINPNFKLYKEFNAEKEEIEKRRNEIIAELKIDLKDDNNQNNQNDNNNPNGNISNNDNNSINITNEANNDNVNSKETQFVNKMLLDYYDIVFDIDSLEKLKKMDVNLK